MRPPSYHVFLEQGTQEPSEGFECLRMVEVTGRKAAKTMAEEWCHGGRWRCATIDLRGRRVGNYTFMVEADYPGWGGWNNTKGGA